MSKNLVIVESPAKAKTIEKYLGKDFSVKASVGHVKDLPVSKLGVDIENNFEPSYEVIKGKKKVIDELKTLASKANQIFLATDPDREGEAIAWHIAQELQGLNKAKKKSKTSKAKEEVTQELKIQRVLFNEITKKAIQEAISKPLELNSHLFDAQQARRVLDRIVGYKISPLLWDKVRRGLSAGRVQSVAVRLICDREEEIRNFKVEEYWSLNVELKASKLPHFWAKLTHENNKKIEIYHEADALKIKENLLNLNYLLKEVQKKERKRHPSPPFITSTLQQEAARKLGFSAKKTMMLAQKLYEGVELSGERVGLITYMRTDSVRLSPEALSEVRDHISKKYGSDYLPPSPNYYKGKKSAQDAHEAIRPTSISHEPEVIAQFLEKDERRLYELIWKRFVACQMLPAIFDQTHFFIQAGTYDLKASGSILKFPGFISVYLEGKDEEKASEEDSEENVKLPDLQSGEDLKFLQSKADQHFTQAPPRYTEASLVKELEEKGIGRPSTYAAILSTIVDKKYVDKENAKFKPSSLGEVVNKLLVENFPDILNVSFTAKMENELDEVEEGQRKWTQALSDFYGPFSKTLEQAKLHMKDIKRQEIATDFSCEKCGKAMVVKWGRHGEFMACSGYPECKSTKEIARGEEGGIQPAQEVEVNETCSKCASPMVMKRGRFGAFLACSKYPECKSTKAISVGVNCPKCSSPISERRSKRGKVFYGCTAYPKCDFALWDKPIAQACPQCGSSYLLQKYSKKDGEKLKCPVSSCAYENGSE